MDAKYLAFASITKKITMGIAGLFLIVFLVVHLTINLFLMSPDGGKTFNMLSHFMGTNLFIKLFEVVLFAAIFIHIILGVILQFQNWRSRPVRYLVTNKTKTPFLSKYMIYTGIVIFIFLVIHFINFYFRKLGWVDNTTILESGEPDFYRIAIDLFSNPLYSFVYIVLIILVGFHLNHAFQSAFQTLGLDHSKYTPFIKVAASIYSIIIAVGFCLIPLYFLFIY
ncbi:MAG: succinate dehydrogenase cytochrome b subunit [Bacteroidales bacterium]|nr:succinate dehydrogenase cytochrome b subunit [Bacteroidales bacterium]